jgi:glycosyltransferase involved in cell wall biosynthesis
MSPRPGGDRGSSSTVSVVVPTLNEERNIAWVLTRLPACVDEVIVVDGRSTDNTVEAAREARPDVIVLNERRPGKGAAVRVGLAEARGDSVVMLDADGSMHPREIPRFLTALDAGYDVVKGSRFLPSGGTTDLSRLRMLGNLALLTTTELLYRCSFTDLCYGYMAMRRSVISSLRLNADGFEIEAQIVAHALRAGLTVAEVPSFEALRRYGVSNLRTFHDGSRVLRELLRARMAPWPALIVAAASAASAPSMEMLPGAVAHDAGDEGWVAAAQSGLAELIGEDPGTSNVTP